MGACCPSAFKDVQSEEDVQLEEKGDVPLRACNLLDEHKKSITDALKEFAVTEEKEVEHLFHEVVWKVSKALDSPFKTKTCIPDVYVYNGVHDFVQEAIKDEFGGEIPVAIDLKKSYGPVAKKLEGKPRTLENYKIMWNTLAKHVGFEVEGAFPEKIDPALLKIIISTNPFVTAGLSFEDKKICFNASKHSRNPLTAMIFSNFIEESYANSKVCISPDFKEFELFENNEQVLADSDKWDAACGKFITGLLYFFEVVHAVLHVYAYVILGCAVHSCVGTEMSSFMSQYQARVLIKYLEVEGVLLNKNGLVTGNPVSWPVDYKRAIKSTTWVFKYIAKRKNAEHWFKDFFLAGVPELENNMNLLPALRKYFDVNLFKELAENAWNVVPDTSKEEIDGSIVNYFRHCSGPNSSENYFSMTNFRDWIQVQSMLGILHGSTLNISRLTFTPYVHLDGLWHRKDIGRVSDIWGLVGATMTGLKEDHAFAQASPGPFQKMMAPFQEKVAKLQQDFWDNLSKEEKKNYGWWYSVWGPNMVGKTQLTVTTYV